MATIDPAPPSRSAVAVVTVNWNGWRTTLACLDALRASRDAEWRLFLVDNASSDGSAAMLDRLGDDVVLIASPVNGGWTGGNNLGVGAALAAGYRRILLLNNDAFVEPDTLATLVAAAGLEEGGPVLGPVHLDGAGDRYDFVGTDLDPRTGFPVWKDVADASVAALPDLIATSSIKGAGIFADARHFERIGGFDDAFYLNFDETDWCYRARAAGYELLMVKAARIRHLGSASIGGMASPLQTYFLARNALLFARKHCGVAQRLRLLRRLYWEARDLPRRDLSRRRWIWRFLRGRDDPDAAFRLGVRDYLAGRFGDCPPKVRAWQRAGRTDPE